MPDGYRRIIDRLPTQIVTQRNDQLLQHHRHSAQLVRLVHIPGFSA